MMERVRTEIVHWHSDRDQVPRGVVFEWLREAGWFIPLDRRHGTQRHRVAGGRPNAVATTERLVDGVAVILPIQLTKRRRAGCRYQFADAPF
ncbi:MAG TPA: hypothetical protein VGV07_20050 [Devosia sp.]|jgi:hypothetical protein|uniref:hypothetical protein n=1 Tax=Devosia sp. TaxID=1871048 RepID=UPI002DDD859A|nr:hypothetical protein [Devosia sp.]HEV2517558.1 hypothetical protein [Devosia sp.]